MIHVFTFKDCMLQLQWLPIECCHLRRYALETRPQNLTSCNMTMLALVIFMLGFCFFLLPAFFPFLQPYHTCRYHRVHSGSTVHLLNVVAVSLTCNHKSRTTFLDVYQRFAGPVPVLKKLWKLVPPFSCRLVQCFKSCHISFDTCILTYLKS